MSSKAKAIQGEGAKPHITEDDDVEGHGHLKAVEGEDNPRVTEDTEDDVEGHNIGMMDPTIALELGRARERDIQRALSRNSLISESKRFPEAKRGLGRKR